MSKPTIILIHGAWHSPAYFSSLITSLEQHGYKVVSPALPSIANSHVSPSPSNLEDVQAIRSTILSELETANVIVVPHSYGGIPTTSALEGLDTNSRITQGHATSVVAIAALTSFILPAGTTLQESQNRPALDITEMPATIAPIVPEDIFFHDGSEDDKRQWITMLKPMSTAAFADASRYSAHEAIPLHYLLCGDDRAISLETQRSILAALEPTAKQSIRTEVIEGSGHAPFLTRVDETVAFLRRSAGEVV
ncbi:hypothetical protein RBB50_011311 [Rhinocladiella similis]